MKAIIHAVLLAGIFLCPGCGGGGSGGGDWDVSASIKSDQVMVFNGVAQWYGWGEDLIYQASPDKSGIYSMNDPYLGGIPLIDIWSEEGGVALFNLADRFEPFEVRLTVSDEGNVSIQARGGSNIIQFNHQGDCFEALREYANRMQSEHGIAVKPAPAWAFDPIWETYGFEENWSTQTVTDLIPLLQELGIKTITLDSGWYGTGTVDWDAFTGDFPINPDVIGTEQDFTDFISDLHTQSFKVRLWWVPGVAEKTTTLYSDHPDWFYSKVIPSWGDEDETGDWYLDPTIPEVKTWNIDLVERFIGYGADGFKQDDVYQIVSSDPAYHLAYAELFADIYTKAVSLDPDFAINTCNCGVAQNFFDFPGENQLITSDPVGTLQFRKRAKYLHALNVNSAAVLGDHVELTQGDIGPDELNAPGFYSQIKDADFASIVALGMVLQTKLTADPGAVYKKWFGLYTQYKFYEMTWINIPYYAWDPVSTYLMQDGTDLYFSFFTETGPSYTGNVNLSHLEPGTSYSVYDIVSETDLASFTAVSDTHEYSVSFSWTLVIRVRKTG